MEELKYPDLEHKLHFRPPHLSLVSYHTNMYSFMSLTQCVMDAL